MGARETRGEARETRPRACARARPRGPFGIPLELRKRIQSVLVSLHEDREVRKRLALGLVERFVPVGPSSYDYIRMMLEACEAAGFMQIR